MCFDKSKDDHADFRHLSVSYPDEGQFQHAENWIILTIPQDLVPRTIVLEILPNHPFIDIQKREGVVLFYSSIILYHIG